MNAEKVLASDTIVVFSRVDNDTLFQKQIQNELPEGAEMGVDSTPMEGIEPLNYDKILGLQDYTTSVTIAIGFRDEEDFNPPNKKQEEILTKKYQQTEWLLSIK